LWPQMAVTMSDETMSFSAAGTSCQLQPYWPLPLLLLSCVSMNYILTSVNINASYAGCSRIFGLIFVPHFS
jgi:hypothetical protein